jgi:hypothetical protein
MLLVKGWPLAIEAMIVMEAPSESRHGCDADVSDPVFEPEPGFCNAMIRNTRDPTTRSPRNRLISPPPRP